MAENPFLRPRPEGSRPGAVAAGRYPAEKYRAISVTLLVSLSALIEAAKAAGDTRI